MINNKLRFTSKQKTKVNVLLIIKQLNITFILPSMYPHITDINKDINNGSFHSGVSSIRRKHQNGDESYLCKGGGTKYEVQVCERLPPDLVPLRRSEIEGRN